MVKPKNYMANSEEIAKKIDQRLDRNGFFTIMVVIGLLLLVLALFTFFWQRPTRNVKNLEHRIIQLENRVTELEEALAEGAQ